MTGPGAGEPRAQVIRADPADLDTLSQVVAEAFHDLAVSRWLIADPAARRKIFPGYFRVYVEHAMTHAVVQTTDDRAAVALWLPTDSGDPDPPADYDAQLRAATGSWIDRFLAFDAALEARHPVGIRHHYLALLAVRPDRQGRGTGTALLRSYHAILDRDAGAPAYLEASDLHTRRIYLRHGYADHGPPIPLPGGPPMYPMWREGRPGAKP
jgi:GNAT superfamily N-acetyltransferase